MMRLESVDMGMHLEAVPGPSDVKTEERPQLRQKERMIISKKDPIIFFPEGCVFSFFGVPAQFSLFI